MPVPLCRLALVFPAILGYALTGTASPESQAQQPQAQQSRAQPPSQESTPAPQQKIAVEVKVVNVLATVRDKHGKTISSLTKDDFALTEDGKLQTITYFTRETDLPLRLGLLVDTSLSQRRVLEEERTASYSFLDHLLRVDKDLAFVIHFDREVELLQEFTPSRPKLQAALQLLQTPQSDGGYRGGGGGSSGSGGGSGGGGRGQHQRGAGTLLYDAVYLASNELMSKQQGRKALIILSDGVDHGSKETLATAIGRAARRHRGVLDFVQGRRRLRKPGRLDGRRRAHGRRSYGRRPPRGTRPAARASRRKENFGADFQGNRRAPVRGLEKETIEKIYADIEEELRNQYSLGYPLDKAAGAGYHRLQVTTKQKDLIVQARDGYYLGQ